MHQLIKIDQYMMTRDLIFKNLQTGTIDVCFDDSDLLSKEDNFNFLKIGEIYDCKILLFGDLDCAIKKFTVYCKVLEKDVIIGKSKLVHVKVEEEEYYILQSIVESELHKKGFFFSTSRKDIIQVDNIVHRNLVKE